MRRAAWVGLVLLVVGGCAPQPHTRSAAMKQAGDALREVIDAQVADTSRRSQALQQVDRLTRELEGFGSSIEAWRGEMTRLLADYRTTRRDVDQLVGVANTNRARSRARVLDARLALAKLLTAEEWRAVAAADAKLLGDWASAESATD
ncbi:MAG: hypothetical protein ABI629_22045 [bacterium]